MPYLITNVYELTQSELISFDENWTVENFCEYSNGSLVRLYKSSILEYDKRPDIVQYISGLICSEEWDYVLVDWSW